MKKSLLLAILPLLALSYGYAQSIFPLDGSSAGIGTNIPSSYFHGGNNKVLEIANPNTSLHSQAHLILSTGAVTPNSSAGTITWIAKNATNTKGLAYIASNTEGDASVNAAGNLVFATSNGNTVVERMRINSLGNVGIGTSNPAFPLDIYGILRSYNIISHISSGGIGLNVTNGEDADFQVNVSAPNAAMKFAQIGSGVVNVPLLINPTNNGNVGIGTTNPQNKLDVAGDIMVRNQQNIGGQGASILFTPYGEDYLHAASVRSYLDFAAGPESRVGLVLSSFWNGKKMDELTLTAGNVGIGTKSPDEKLTVYGNIHAQGVKVDLNVPFADYVFAPGYQLWSLADVKTYIDKNHHLPEIPSAAQVAKDGINLGEMNAKLLKKIEELTLYLIEEHKNNQELSRSVAALLKKVQQLSKKRNKQSQ